MEITEVRIKLMPMQNDKLRAFCSITIDDDFVVRDLKVIEGMKGPFVAMPSRKLMQRCRRCSGKNHHRASYCNDCGARLDRERRSADPAGRSKLHADIAHPINSRCRELIQKRILELYAGELERAKDPNYRPIELDVFDEDSLRETIHEGAGTESGSESSSEVVDSPGYLVSSGLEGDIRRADGLGESPPGRSGVRSGVGRRAPGGGDPRGGARGRPGGGRGRAEEPSRRLPLRSPGGFASQPTSPSRQASASGRPGGLDGNRIQRGKRDVADVTPLGERASMDALERLREAQRPEASPPRGEEPEDNFGVGLFS